MSRIVEFFGYDPLDRSAAAVEARGMRLCPFVGTKCTKRLNDKSISGACSLRQVKNTVPVITCPNRLYQDSLKTLRDVARVAFGSDARLVHPDAAARITHDGKNVAVFGRGSGKELKLPKVGGRGGFFVDWVLALLDVEGRLSEFVAVEVQSIDTNGNYRAERDAYLEGHRFAGQSPANPNWENVSKRILPQIIYKSHVLGLERLCRQGMFFICPGPVHDSIMSRLGGRLSEYPNRSPSTITFRWYDPGPPVEPGRLRELVSGGQFTTTVEQVALGFTAPSNLPRPNSYEDAIRRELEAARVIA